MSEPKVPSQAEREALERKADEAESRQSQVEAPIDFVTFVLSLGSTALVHLGAAPAELFEGGQMPPANYALAKQTIDLLAMLEEKTAGNLNGEEEQLLSQLLYDLRMRYVGSVK
ncbi:MAG: DUF1844 domain-containing protein [Sandaracinus sp.]|nr:DUF1844 domain-containing protein [Sandaracinus sp.]MCB9613244.1 DUF1844 domain-containing protein [Sandaracinus sp.]